MGVRSSSTRRTSAASAISGQIVAINTPSGGVSVAGGRITATTPVSLGVVTAGQSSAASVVVATSAPTVTSLIITDSSFNNLDDTAFDVGGGYAKIIGTNFKAGASAYVNGQALTTTFTSANELRVVVPASAIGSYSLMVFNTDGSGAIYLGLGVSNLPTFVTDAGTLGTFYETTNIVASTTATGDSPITYTLYSGTLPPGATLAADGTITGTSPTEASSTVYSFVIKASDAQNQDSYRAFSITISSDVITWNSPAQGTISLEGSAMAPVVLSATAATGNAVSYSVDTLPDGLSFNTDTITGTPTTEGITNTILTATSAVTNRTATRTVTWSVSLADIYFKYTTLLLGGTTPAPSFINDSSLNNAQLTIQGDAKPSNFNPYQQGYYSNYFDGTGDYLTAPANSSLTLGTSDYTVECWVHLMGTQTTTYGWGVIGTYPGGGAGWSLTINRNASSQGIAWIMNDSIVADYTTSYIPTNTWTHIAITRSGTAANNTKIFINGVVVKEVTNNTNDTFSGVTYIGGQGTGQLFTGMISNARVVKGSAVYTSNFTPSTEPLTAIANTSLLTCQSNRFLDNSTNNFAITKTGDVKVSSFVPFAPPTSTFGSAYFDGTGDALTSNSIPGYSFGAGNFTIEGWINPAVVNIDSQAIVLRRGSSYVTGDIELVLTNASLVVFCYDKNSTTSCIIGTTPVLANSWTHFALVRNENTMTLYQNGIPTAASISMSGVTIGDNSQGITIGRDNVGPRWHFTGYIADIRVVKGTALYTANFLPPQQPLTAVTNTQLLTLQSKGAANNNGFVDQSGFNNAITRTGNVTQGTFSPFSQTGWSTYFDGISRYSASAPTTLGTSDFTIEFWYYPIDVPSKRSLLQYGSLIIIDSGTALNSWIGSGGPSGPKLNVNSWNHIAAVRVSGTLKLYVNGVSGSGVSFGNDTATPVVVGYETGSSSAAYGYISNLRVVIGTGLSQSTTPTIPLSAINNTVLLLCQDNRIVDKSSKNVTFTSTGTPSSQAFSPFGSVTSLPTSYSNYFDGATSSQLVLPSNSVFSFGTGAYTMEAWVFINTASANVATVFDAGNATNAISLGVAANGAVQIGKYGVGTALISSAGDVLAGRWVHIAAVRTSTAINDTKLYVNGVLKATGTDANNWTVINTPTIGGINLSGFTINGYISSLRVIKGTAFYTSDFTPSTTPLTAVANTSLLTCQAPTLVDNSANKFTLTASGNVTPRPFNPFGTATTTNAAYSPSVNGGSMYFDGTGDYLTAGTFAPGTNNFTVECWFYPTAWPASQGELYCTPWGGNNFQLMLNSGGTIQWQAYTQSMTAVSLNGLNQWYHVAVVKNGSSAYLYVNGVLRNTSTLTNIISGTAFVGARGADGLHYSGYISDLRVNIGSVLYTSNFYPGTAPATPTQLIGTTRYSSNLLLNGTSGGIVDAHGSNNLETIGNTQLASEDPYGESYYSNYFDGSGDYLSLSYNSGFDVVGGDFTIECWFQFTALAALNTDSVRAATIATFGPATANIGWELTTNQTNNTILFSRTGDNANKIVFSYTLELGKWYHIAVVRNSSTNYIYMNGVSQTLSTNSYTGGSATSGSLTVGYAGRFAGYDLYFPGYISNLRVVKGTAVYTANFTPSTTPLTAISGTSLLTCQSNSFKDNSTNNFAITKNGDTKVKSMNPFRNNTGKSLYFDGTGDYLTSDTVSRYLHAFGSGDFTIEMCVYFNVVTTLAILYDHRNGGNGSYPTIYVNSGLLYYYANSGDMISKSVTAGQWYHVAVTRNSGTTRLFVNGTTTGTSAVNGVSDTYVYLNEANRPSIASSGMTIGTGLFNGYIKDLRVTKGVARYTSNFTAPSKLKAL